MESTVIRIYTNDLEVERLKQANAPEGQDRLGVLRNRIARSKARNLVAIAAVAKERGDNTIAKEARASLTDMGVLASGQPLTDVYELVNSRRASHSKEMASLTGQEPTEVPEQPELPVADES